MARRIYPRFTPAPDAASGEWTLVRPADKKGASGYFGFFNETEESCYIAFGDEAPTDITEAIRVKAGGNWQAPVTELVHDACHVYHEQGVTIQSESATAIDSAAFKYCEG